MHHGHALGDGERDVEVVLALGSIFAAAILDFGKLDAIMDATEDQLLQVPDVETPDLWPSEGRWGGGGGLLTEQVLHAGDHGLGDLVLAHDHRAAAVEHHTAVVQPLDARGEPAEIARCVVFLASDDAGFVTGSTISANGGV